MSVKPVHYELYLRPDLDKFTFFGYEDIVLDIEKPITEVVLNSVGLEIVRRTYIIQNGTIHNCSSIAYDEEAQTVNIKFTEGLSAGEAILHIEFNGVLGDNLSGFYRARYTLPDGTERYMATTQFEAADARRAFPCFDEPAMKATFRVMITAPEDRTVLSNMPVRIEAKTGDGQKIVVFETTPKMSTYLLAFIVGDLESVEGTTKSGTLFRVFATPGNKELCQFALDVGIRILEYKEDYYGIPFPLPKIDMVAVPDFAMGAMENWGLVTYRDIALLVDEDSSSFGAKRVVASIISHELEHQWFGNLVTMEWWNDLWLNEGFASWGGDNTIDAIFPDWQTWDLFYVDDTARGLELDGLQSTHPIEVEVKSPEEIDQIFDAISYSKGASIIRMLENYLGKEVFREGLRRYLLIHQYGNARTENLWNALQEVFGKPVAKMMDTWTKQPGYPVLHVSEEHGDAGRTLKLSQERFFYGESTEEERSGQLWSTPLVIMAASLQEPEHTLVDKRNDKFTLTMPRHERSNRDWVKLNWNQAGFFRVHYSDDMLRALFPAISSLELPAVDRLGLVGDVNALSQAGTVSVTQLLDMVEHYKNEDEFVVWDEINSGLAHISSLLSDEPYHNKLRAFARKIFVPIGKRIGWDPRPDEKPSNVFLRNLVLGRLGALDHSATIETARQKFEEFMADRDSLAPDLRGVVCSIVATHGDKATYETFLKLYREAEIPEEKVRYLTCLGRFRKAALLKRALAFSLSDEVRSQDFDTLIAFTGVNKKGGKLAWEFLKDNWDEIMQKFGSGISIHIGRLIESVISGFKTPDAKREAEDFFKEHPVPAADMALRQSLERVDINIAWLEKNREAVGRWLEEGPTSG